MSALKSPSGRLFTIATTSAISLIFASQAWAVDANAVAQRIKDFYAGQNVDITYESVVANGADITLKNTTARMESVAPDSFAVGDVVLSNVSEGKNDSYVIDTVTVPDFSIDEKGDDQNKVVVKGISMEDVVIPSPKSTNPLEKTLFYGKSAVALVEVGQPETDGVRIKDIVVTTSAPQGYDKIDFSMNVAEIAATFKDDEANPLSDFGMTTLNASISSKGNWTPANGNVDLSDFTIKADKIGSLTLVTNIGGYDLEFVKALQETQTSMTKADADQSAAALAMLGLSEQLTIGNMEIRFNDDSLTNKLLEYYAKEQGSDVETLRQQVSMMVPLLATQLNNPEFAAKVKTASDTFFANPKSLTLSASPAQPVSLAAIIATASLDPTKLIDLLKVNIAANN